MFNGPHSEESKRKISQNSAKFHLGKKLSFSHRENLRKSHLGNVSGMLNKHHSNATKQKIREKRAKQVFTEETRNKLSIAHKGDKHWNWRGGVTPISNKIRNSAEYRLWRDAVYKRDNWTCVWCQRKGGKLNADHIKPFALFPELRFAIDNGRTLCVPCHQKTDTYLNRWYSKNDKHEKDL